jgi:hypothetical protein
VLGKEGSEMNLPEQQNNPHVIRLRYSYAAIIKAIADANGSWHPVDPKQVCGTSKATKQKVLWQAATQRGFKIRTTYQADGYLYARLIIEAVSQ